MFAPPAVPSIPAPAVTAPGTGPLQPPAHANADPSSQTGLKVVTISPATHSIPDIEAERPLPRRNDPYLGCTIDGRYKVEDVIGEGGMGVVYRCTHKIIGKKVAMKVLRADLARDKELMERFLNEAKSASAIGNPHIIDISDFGELPDGSTYFVMEFLNGVPLSAQVEGGRPLPVPRLLHIARQLAEGLSAAHHSEIVHRDLKPDNIFLVSRSHEKDFVKILDFGIAKVSTSAEGRLTRAGAVFGTPHYMSPEQAAGTPVDHRGDVYSFGVILYELASGKVPFDADNFMGILTQHMYKAPVPIRALVPQPEDVPAGLEAIVLKCLSKRPEQRYQTMNEIISDIDKLRQGMIPDAVPEMMARSGGFNVPADYFKKGGMPAPMPATPGTPRRPRTAWPLYAGAAGVAVAVGAVVAIFVSSASSTATPQPETTPAPAAAPAAEALDSPGAPVVLPKDDFAVMRQVALAVEPLDARVFRGGQDLGTSPVVIEVEEGKIVNIEIRRDGYKTRVVKLDGTTPKASVKLERTATATRWPRARPAEKPRGQAPAAKSKPKSNLGGGEIVNPWE
ncbi:MAG TPA: serine/threonine-protein kinase [Polyangiaceae bacterium]|nr:serine/threonine-protein kinase [Polyangiaceae bacterium]